MQVSGLKTELDKLQRDAEIKPLRILLKYPPSDITDTQLTNLLLTVPIKQLPASVLMEVSARENRLRMETRLACELNRRGRI